MSAATYVAGMGLACALGDAWPHVLAALQRPPAAPARVLAAEGFDWPLHAMAPRCGAWTERLAPCVRAVVAQCGAPPDAGLPLFIASSSLDAGFEEEGGGPNGPFAGDVQTFADGVARSLDWRGPVFTISTACTSAANAVLAAVDLIAAGEATDALVLGIEFSNRFTLAGFGAMQLLSPDRARPFGVARNGLVLGEAVAALHLRAAPARWQVLGGANGMDGRNPTGAQHDTVVAVCRAALQRCGLQPADIDLVKPHAAGSISNDAIEAAALHEVFAQAPPMVTFKQHIGHTLGAAGAAELALLIACAEQGVRPPHDGVVDPALGIAFALPDDLAPRHLLMLSIGFGGGHAALVLKDHRA